MFVPKGFLNFFEIAEEARQLARDLVWAYRATLDDSGFVSIRQEKGERDASEAWLICQLAKETSLWVCSSSGALLRAPPLLAAHADQLEMLFCPIPLAESSLSLPEYDDSFEVEQHFHFRNRFFYFDWQLGTVKQKDNFILSSDFSQFSEATATYLEQREAMTKKAMAEYSGWNICVPESVFDGRVDEVVQKFGITDHLLQHINKDSPAPIHFGQNESRGRPRMRDDILEIYKRLYPEGHETQGLSIKGATAAIIKEYERPFSPDTLLRALGKKE